MQSKFFGGHIQMNTEIIDGKYDVEKKVWILNNGQFQGRLIINCAGLYGDYIEQIRLKQESSLLSTFTIQPRIGQFSVYSSSSPSISLLPIKSIILPIPTKFTKGIIVYPNLFNQIIVGPTAETQIDRIQAPIKSTINKILSEKIYDLIPTFSNFNYHHIGSYTGIRPATEYSDYQIKSYHDFPWICCGGIRSTGLTSSLAIGEYVNELINEMNNIKSQSFSCEGYSLEKYLQSLDYLKSIFNLTSNGLQPKLIINQSNIESKSVGNIEINDNIKVSNLAIDCSGEIFYISHSLLKLAWTTNEQH